SIFKKKKKDIQKFRAFCKDHAGWLEDYSIYKVLHDKYNDHWINWPKELKNRDLTELKKIEKSEKFKIEKIKFLQYIFFKQWKHLKIHAFQNQVHLIGDIPIYINHDSADCWAHSQYFKLDKNKNPTQLSGVPPDYYSDTGQLWGTPVYNWKNLKNDKYGWWIQRLRQNLLLFDILRLDHFRGFSAYWEVRAGEKTAQNGKWVNTPGNDFFRTVKKEIPNMPFIAEDLGSLDKDVYNLIDKFNFPGMNVLQFAFGDDKATNPYLPFNHKPNSLVYTGTHDNNTTLGWFESLDSNTSLHLKEYFDAELTSENINNVMHRAALNSVAKIAILPMQDILELDSRAVMNIPGSTKGHWGWRMTYEQLSIAKAVELKALNQLYGR
ncbi:MAG TPA: 4-alpha-glucanotransferase, partial [Gillisia sp.]|nr:4-alpha-glucanotransferase [Gillisia sp.]